MQLLCRSSLEQELIGSSLRQDYGLHATLGEFRCERKCPYKDGTHPIGARSQGNRFNAAAIPDALAEEVAEYVHAKFVLDRIRHTKQMRVT